MENISHFDQIKTQLERDVVTRRALRPNELVMSRQEENYRLDDANFTSRRDDVLCNFLSFFSFS